MVADGSEERPARAPSLAPIRWRWLLVAAVAMLLAATGIVLAALPNA